MSVIGTLLVKMALDAAGFRQDMAGASQSFVEAGQRISQAGMDLAPVSVPILALGQSALSSAIDFESGMNVFQATSQATASEMDRMQQLATELGADMQLPGTSAADAAEAMIELGRRGLEVNEVFDASRGVLELSAAGQLSNARAAELTASALNAFNLEGSDASRIANLLAAGSTASGTSIDQMGQALQQSAAVFAAADIPIEQLVTSIGMMAKAGIQGSDAGTSLKTMLMALQAPSSTAAAAMADLGINIYDAHGKMLPFPAIIEQFSSALADGATRTVTIGGATREMAAAAEAAQGKMTNLERALVVAEAHTGMTADTMRGLIQQWVSANGTLDGFGRTLGGNTYELFRAVQGYDSARNSIAQFNTAQGTAHSSTVALSEAERNRAMATIFGTDAVRAANIVMMAGSAAFTEMEGASTRQGAAAELAAARMQGLGGAIEGFRSSMETTLMNAVMPFLPQLTNLVTSIGDFVGRLGEANPALLNAGVAIAGVLAVAGPLLMAIGPLTVAFGVLTGPIGLVVLAVAAVAAAFASGAVTIDQIRPILDGVSAAFQFVKQIVTEVFTAVQGIISGAMQVIRGDISGGMETIRGAFQTAWQNIGSILEGALTAIITYVQTNLPSWIARLGEWAEAAWQWLVDAVPPMLEKLGRFVGDLLEEIGRRLPGWVEKLVDWAAAAWQWLVDAVPPLLEKLGAFVARLLEELGRKLPGWIAGFLEWAAEAVAWVTRAIPPLLVKLGEFLAAAVTWIIGTGVPALVREAVRLAGALIDWVANDLIPAVGPALGEFLTEVVNFIVGMVEAVAQAAWSIGEGIVNGIRQGISDLWDEFRNWVGGLITAVIDWLKGLMGIKSPSRVFADEIGRPMIEGILVGAQEAAPGAIAGLAQIITDMVTAMTNAAGGLGNLGGAGNAAGFISGLIQFVSDLVRAFHEATSWITTAAINVKAQSDAFNAAAQEMLQTLQAGIEILLSIQDINIPINAIDLVSPLINFVSELVRYMHERISWITTATINVKAQSDAFNAAAQEMITTLSMGIELINSLETFNPRYTVVAQIQLLVNIVSDLARIMATALVAAGMQVVVAARVFAETIAPVFGLIDSAVNSLRNMENLQPVDVDRVFRMIRQTLIDMVRVLRDAQNYVGHLVEAATAFATRLLPAIKPVTDTFDLLLKFGDWKPVDVDRIFHSVRQVLVDMVWVLNQAASYVDSIVVAAAAFATRLAPAIAPVTAAFDLLVKMAEWQPVDVDRVFHSIRQTIIDMVRALRQADEYVGWALPQATAFAVRLGELVAAVNDVIDVLVRLAEVDVPAAAAVIAKVWEEIQAIIIIIRNGLLLELQKFDPPMMMAGAFALGASWIKSLIAGIWSAMPELESVLSYIVDLFPHSPAKAGPLRRTPDWTSYMTYGLDQAGDTLVKRLSAAMPAGGRLALAPAATGVTGARTGQTINVTINNPKGQASERSIRRELLMLSQLGVLE